MSSWMAYSEDLAQMTREGQQGLAELRGVGPYVSANVLARKVQQWKEEFEMKWAVLAHRHMQEIPDQVGMMERFLQFRTQADELITGCRRQMAQPSRSPDEIRSDAEMRAQIRAADQYALDLQRDSMLYARRAQSVQNWRFTRYLRDEPYMHYMPYYPF